MLLAERQALRQARRKTRLAPRDAAARPAPHDATLVAIGGTLRIHASFPSSISRHRPLGSRASCSFDKLPRSLDFPPLTRAGTCWAHILFTGSRSHGHGSVLRVFLHGIVHLRLGWPGTRASTQLLCGNERRLLPHSHLQAMTLAFQSRCPRAALHVHRPEFGR